MHRAARAVSAFFQKAYQDGLTGLAAMVAYNLLASIFPLALIALFIFSRVLQSPELAASVLSDAQTIFPRAAESTLTQLIERVQQASTTVGIVALVSSLWVGTSFWGALDTAFCRIYHLPCRSWVRQKLFGLGMLGVVLLFIAASIFVPAIESGVVNSTDRLPFGLAHIKAIDTVLLLGAALLITFLICSVIFWAVPKGHMPWRAVWPGATFVTVTVGAANWAFPFYLANASSLSRFGSTLGFVLITLLWFYALSLALLAGAVINSLRHELHDTGEMPYWTPEAAKTERVGGCSECD